MNVQQLAAQSAGRWIRAKITHEDLTETTANTAEAIDVLALEAGDIVLGVFYHLKTAFEDASDAAFNNVTLSLGDGASATALMSAQQVNVNGTEILNALTMTGKAYPAAATLKATFGSMSGKSLSNIDTGEVYIFALVVKAPDWIS